MSVNQGRDMMKIHHAAALALIGWYLMMPPPYWSKTIPNTAPPGNGRSLAVTIAHRNVPTSVRR